MTINWEEFDEKLKNIKYPHVLIYNFFNNILKIEDKHSSIILRYIIKNNVYIFVKNPFYLLANKLSDYHPETKDILTTFYDLLKKRKKIFDNIKKWYLVYEKPYFWKKSIDDQILFLIDLKMVIQGIFDNSKGGVAFPYKMLPIMKSNINNEKEHIIKSASERLKKVYKLLGRKFYIASELPIILSEEFEYLEDDVIFKYTNDVFLKSVDILTTTITLFEDFKMVNLKLDNLINPFLVNIEEETISVYETDDVEDLKILF